jgi:hypothetical protein
MRFSLMSRRALSFSNQLNIQRLVFSNPLSGFFYGLWAQ